MKIERVHIDRIKLRTELAKKDMSRRTLSELSGISENTISAIVGGKQCMPNTAHKIADALGVGLNELIVINESA